MKTIKKQKVDIQWVDEIPDELKDNTIYISTYRHKIIHKCLCGCGKTITMIRGEFRLNLLDRKNKTMILQSMNCPSSSVKYFICRGSEESNYSPVANFI